MYKNYIFDLYGTLIDINTNERSRYLWEKMACFYSFYGADYGPSELYWKYVELCKQEEKRMSDIDYPEIELSYVFQQLFQKKSVDADIELAVQTGKIFRILSIQYIRLYDGVTELLDELKKAGRKILLLSNAQRIFSESEMKMLKIYDYFDGILFSSDQSCRKPSPLFYQSVLEKYQIDKKESIMIGNDPVADIKGAYDIGLPSLYIKSNLSPDDNEELLSTYSIMDGNVYQIRNLILK
ncbi:MAG: hydrolase, family [Eubacterium sp.]|jgi:putative hydrolase of the HAD superfamily|nr:hydrolase, family [Eubacterium sp.]